MLGCFHIISRKLIDRCDSEGPSGLYDKSRSGRPPKVMETVRTEIDEGISKAPWTQGFILTVWTITMIQ